MKVRRLRLRSVLLLLAVAALIGAVALWAHCPYERGTLGSVLWWNRALKHTERPLRELGISLERERAELAKPRMPFDGRPFSVRLQGERLLAIHGKTKRLLIFSDILRPPSPALPPKLGWAEARRIAESFLSTMDFSLGGRKPLRLSLSEEPPYYPGAPDASSGDWVVYGSCVYRDVPSVQQEVFLIISSNTAQIFSYMYKDFSFPESMEMQIDLDAATKIALAAADIDDAMVVSSGLRIIRESLVHGGGPTDLFDSCPARPRLVWHFQLRSGHDSSNGEISMVLDANSGTFIHDSTPYDRERINLRKRAKSLLDAAKEAGILTDYDLVDGTVRVSVSSAFYGLSETERKAYLTASVQFLHGPGHKFWSSPVRVLDAGTGNELETCTIHGSEVTPKTKASTEPPLGA